MDPLVVQYVDEVMRVLDRIATALERRDVVEVKEVFKPGDVADLLKAGWVLLQCVAAGSSDEMNIWYVLGRPRSVTP